MPQVYPFRAVRCQAADGDVSSRIAPPYDVLDADAKAALLERDPNNIVAIDLPHVPAKELGPPEAYQAAADAYRRWLADGVLTREEQPLLGAYRQTFEFGGETHRRSGMFCTVETVPFGPREGGGVLPHEQTFSGPKEDRFALMKATAAQLSPIFGLHPDDSGRATAVIQTVTARGAPDLRGSTSDGVLHEIWLVRDEATIRAYQDALAGEDAFVADGHHRYTTGLNYLRSLEEQGEVPADHPARRCMMVLVGMSDPGLVIGPTHRVLGGMADYSWQAFQKAAEKAFTLEPVDSPEAIEAALTSRDGIALGFVDFASGRCFVGTPVRPDPLAEQFGDKPEAWRTLDVAVVQHVVVERICQPALNGGNPVTWAFPHSVEEVMEIGRGAETGAGGGAGFGQLGVIVRPTPLNAVRKISRAGELMPQKSTFFYPKLATGLFVNPLG